MFPMSGKSPRELAKQFEAPAPVEPARPSSVSPRAVAAAKVKKEIAAGQKADMPNVPKKRVKDKQCQLVSWSWEHFEVLTRSGRGSHQHRRRWLVGSVRVWGAFRGGLGRCTNVLSS